MSQTRAAGVDMGELYGILLLFSLNKCHQIERNGVIAWFVPVKAKLRQISRYIEISTDDFWKIEAMCWQFPASISARITSFTSWSLSWLSCVYDNDEIVNEWCYHRIVNVTFFSLRSI